MYELAIEYGQKLISKQTGFIHLYRGKDEGIHDTIPILENFCYAYALLRSRKKENIEKAKTLFDKLLPFQADSGSFPIYLHEYPNCNSLCLPLYLLPIMHWIRTKYFHLLGSELIEKLALAEKELLMFAKKNQALFSTPFQYLFFAILSLHEQDFNRDKLLEVQQELESKAFSFSTRTWETILLSYLVFEMDFGQQRLMEIAYNFYHEDLQSYAGPAYYQHQERFEPSCTFFDLFFTQDKISTIRLSNPSFVHLLSPFIRTIDFSHLNKNCDMNHEEYFLMQRENFSLFACKTMPEIRKNGTHLLRILWKGQKQLHSLAIQEVFTAVDTKLSENDIEMIFTLPDEVPDREETMELSVYFNRSEENKIFVNGIKATSFHLEDKLELQSYHRNFTLSFSLVEGEGKFWGHIMRHNRPSQTHKSTLECHDMKLALRTIGRSSKAKLKLHIAFK